MSNTKTIADYTAAVGINATTDFLLIEQSSVYNKINRNVLLGLSSAPLGTTDSQSPTNKTFDNTNSLTIKDGNFTIQNSSSTTKQAVFSAASITAGQTRTFTFPDASGTLVTTAGTQTLTNKTLTSPTISGGTIDNSTITVDSIAGHSSATIVTVANLQISNGVLNTANAVTSTSIAAGAVQPQALQSGTGTGWAWSTWTAAPTNFTLGNGSTSYGYIQIGKTVFFRLKITFGSTTSISGSVTFSLPVTSTTGISGAGQIGSAVFYQPGVAAYYGYPEHTTTTTGTLYVFGATGTYLGSSTISSTVPFTWGTGNQLLVEGYYEAA